MLRSLAVQYCDFCVVLQLDSSVYSGFGTMPTASKDSGCFSGASGVTVILAICIDSSPLETGDMLLVFDARTLCMFCLIT